jgi:hypothetical protein
MQRRGELTRRLIPSRLEAASNQMRSALGHHGSDFAIEGRDATGRKARIPWVRYFSQSRSPNPQQGWYCVYLFDGPGTSVYLELGHGSTTFVDGEYQPRPPEELARLVAWGQQVLAPVLRSQPGLSQPMVLRGGKLGDAYEHSSVLNKRYAANDVPSDEVLFADAIEFAGYLKFIYDAEVLGLSPAAPAPEIVEVERVASGNSRGFGQGFGLNAAERRAVELHAMQMAKACLLALNWRVRDVSSSKPYDFECRRGEETLAVEVKGTTSAGEQIVLTRNEVAAHQSLHPNTALIVVHSISLQRDPRPKAEGGVLRMLTPWKADDQDLRALAYQYRIPPDTE